MNEKITFPELVRALSAAGGISKKLSEEFIKEFFSLISSTISSGDNVRIKGIGTFKIIDVDARKSVNVATGDAIEIAPHKKVSFVPDKKLAEVINKPFAAFESVEIPEDITDNMLDDTLSDAIPAAREDNVVEKIEEEKSETIANVSDIEYVEWSEENTEEVSLSDNDEAVSQLVEPVEESEEETENPKECKRSKGKKKAFCYGVLTGMLLGILILCGLLLVYEYLRTQSFYGLVGDSEEIALQESVLPDSSVVIVETIEESVPTLPSDPLKYDTISTTRFLTTMAKEHYGNYNLWPYIYIENQDFLGHPDRIRPGTSVVIPPLSKYGIDANDKECVENAKKIGAEIYSRYDK